MKFRLLLIASILMLSACANFGRPSEVGSGWYLVKPSDTLYSIAWRYDVHFKTLAIWNNIKPPYLIKPGQYIRLINPNSKWGKSSVNPNNRSDRNKQKIIIKKKGDRPINWVRPTKGKRLNGFSFNDISKRGLDIANKVRQPVVAVASGKVVYSGNGLDGYKNLIIIKHNETYLSAYAQNKNLLVKEGEIVKKGKKIADMGADDKHGFLLHFQIRKNGIPVNPLIYLPVLK